MQIGLELPGDDEIDKLVKAAYRLAVAQVGPESAFEEVRKIFYRLMFEGDDRSGDE